MKLDIEVKRELLMMAAGCAVCSAAAAAVFAVFGYFDMTVLFGVLVGYLLAFGNFFLMAVGVTKALAAGEESAAKLKMRLSYIVRTVLMISVIAISFFIDDIHRIPVLTAVFYPRIVISVRNILSARRSWKA